MPSYRERFNNHPGPSPAEGYDGKLPKKNI